MDYAHSRRGAHDQRWLIRSRYWLMLLAVSLASCSDPVTPCMVDIGHEYLNDVSDIELILDHACATGVVSGSLYDSDGFRYALTGSVEGQTFRFSASRARPSGDGFDTFSSPRGLEILSNGLILRGVLTRNGIGPNVSLSFVRND